MVFPTFFLFGVIIGSFLNVVICRLGTGETLLGRSQCPHCKKTLAWCELVPLFSFLAQWGKCRSCRTRISAQYPLVELLTGALFVSVAQSFPSDRVLLALNLVLVSLLIVIAVYDLRHLIIPDTLVLLLLALAGTQVFWRDADVPDALLGGFIPAAFLGGLWLISRGRWLGFGDAKLVFPLGLIVGFLGSISLLVFSFWIGAVVSVGVLFTQRLLRGQQFFSIRTPRFTMKSEVPFAPFLICAFLLVHLFGADLFALVDFH